MANKRHKPEEIVTKLGKIDALVGKGMAREDAIRELRNETLSAISPRTTVEWADPMSLEETVLPDSDRPTQGTAAAPENTSDCGR